MRTPAFNQWLQQRFDAEERLNIVERAISDLERSLEQKNGQREIVTQQPQGTVDETLIPFTIEDTGLLNADGKRMAYIEVVSGKSDWLLSIKHMLSPQSAFLNLLQKHKWCCVDMPQGITLPTSDNPVCMLDSIPGMNYDNDNYLAVIPNGGKLIVLPVSPNRAILMKLNGVRLPTHFVASNVFAHYIKNGIIDNAFRAVFSDYEDGSIVRHRPRTVNLTMYKEEEEAFKQWYGEYLTKEAPLLKSNKHIRKWSVEEQQQSEYYYLPINSSQKNIP